MMQRSGRTLVLLAVLVVAAVTACASSASSGERTRRDTTVLTREEMAEVRVSNVYEAVERLRPRWLQIRTPMTLTGATEIVVFMDRSYLGAPDVLRQFSPNDVARLRYLDGPTASASLSGLGSRSVEAAIIVEVSEED